MSMLGYSLDRFDVERPGPYYNSGTYPHRFTAGTAKILSKVGIRAQIVSVLVDTKDANTTLNIYEGTNSSGALIASIVLSKLGTIPLPFQVAGGLYVSCMGGAGSAVVVVDAATYNSTTLTLSGNELTDVTRSANTQGDGRTPPDSSYGVWEPITNTIQNGGFQTNTASWQAQNSATLTRVTTASKFGTASCRVVTGGAGANEGILQTAATSPAAATAQTWTFSVWLKGNAGGESVLLRINELTSGNALVLANSSSAQILTTSWVKYVYTVTLSGGATTAKVSALVITSGTAVVTWFMDGAQLVQKAYTTPYVETDGGTAARGTPRVQVALPGLSFTQGWFACAVRIGIASTDVTNKPNQECYLMRWMDVSHGISAYLNNSGLTAGRDQATGSAGVAQSVSYAAGDTLILIVAWTATQLKASIGGNFATASQTPASFTSATIDLFQIGTGRELDGDVFWAAFGTGTLSNADAATINGFGSTDPLLTDFPGSCIFLWPADTSRYYTP